MSPRAASWGLKWLPVASKAVVVLLTASSHPSSCSGLMPGVISLLWLQLPCGDCSWLEHVYRSVALLSRAFQGIWPFVTTVLPFSIWSFWNPVNINSLIWCWNFGHYFSLSKFCLLSLWCLSCKQIENFYQEKSCVCVCGVYYVCF